MSELLLTNEAHCDFLLDRIAEKPNHVMIASFGIYAGITDAGADTSEWGPKYHLRTRDVVEGLRGIKDVKMLIGVGNYRSCKKDGLCIDCEQQYVKSLIRLTNHSCAFPEFKWRVTTDLHLKCYLFFYDRAVKGLGGGRNLTDSRWEDVTFELSVRHIKQLYDHTNDLWEASDLLNDDTIGRIIESQGVSTAGFESAATEEF